MKGLNYFNHFDWDAFAKDKRFLVTRCAELVDYDTKKHLGTRVDVVITHDKTEYPTKNGEKIHNRFEGLTFKVYRDIQVPADVYVVPVNATATIYGTYRNQLSVCADDIEIVHPAKA